MPTTGVNRSFFCNEFCTCTTMKTLTAAAIGPIVLGGTKHICCCYGVPFGRRANCELAR